MLTAAPDVWGHGRGRGAEEKPRQAANVITGRWPATCMFSLQPHVLTTTAPTGCSTCLIKWCRARFSDLPGTPQPSSQASDGFPSCPAAFAPQFRRTRNKLKCFANKSSPPACGTFQAPEGRRVDGHARILTTSPVNSYFKPNHSSLQSFINNSSYGYSSNPKWHCSIHSPCLAAHLSAGLDRCPG